MEYTLEEILAIASKFVGEMCENLFDNLDYGKAFEYSEATKNLPREVLDVIQRMMEEGIITVSIDVDRNVMDGYGENDE